MRIYLINLSSYNVTSVLLFSLHVVCNVFCTVVLVTSYVGSVVTKFFFSFTPKFIT